MLKLLSPLIAVVPNVSAALPLLLIVIVCGVVDVPTAAVPKLTLLGITELTGTFGAKAACTMQLEVMGPVTYVVPDKVPPQPVTKPMPYPGFVVSVNDVV